MTVQELIDALMKIEDKTLEVLGTDLNRPNMPSLVTDAFGTYVEI